MKRKTAEKNLRIIIDRLHSINGILATPMNNFEAVRIKRAWLFGSFAKGKDEPNDLDIFVELEHFRREYVCTIGKNRFINGMYKLDKSYYRSYGTIRAIRADETFIKWLRKDIRKISVHIVGNDLIFDRLDTKILIYPRCDFNFSRFTSPNKTNLNQCINLNPTS